MYSFKKMNKKKPLTKRVGITKIDSSSKIVNVYKSANPAKNEQVGTASD